jgi:hypothetical protein
LSVAGSGLVGEQMTILHNMLPFWRGSASTLESYMMYLKVLPCRCITQIISSLCSLLTSRCINAAITSLIRKQMAVHSKHWRWFQGCSVDLLDGFSALYYDSCFSSCKYSPTDLTTNLNLYNNIVGIPNYEMELGRMSLNWKKD